MKDVKCEPVLPRPKQKRFYCACCTILSKLIPSFYEAYAHKSKRNWMSEFLKTELIQEPT